MISLSESRILSSNGRDQLRVYEWCPDTEPIAVLQLHHGVSEHIMRYNDFARYLAQKGIFVVGYDCAGHGLSATTENFLNFGDKGWGILAQDFNAIQEKYAAAFPGKPYYVLGHSMGSFVVRSYLADFPGKVDGAILSGTGFKSSAITGAGKLLASIICSIKGDKHVSKLVHGMAMGSYNKKFGPDGGCQWLSCNDEANNKYAADPLSGGVPTVGLYRDMFSGLGYVCTKECANKMDKDVPVLLISGSDDPVGDFGAGVSATADLLKTAGVKDVRTLLYPGLRHEVLNEKNRSDAYEMILRFMSK